MIFKNTWIWIILAVALLGASLWHYRHSRHAHIGSRKLLPQLNAASVTNVQVRFGPQLQIRAERTNSGWVLAEPVVYPAEIEKVEGFLVALEQMIPAVYITHSELINRPNAEEDYGLGTAPQATIILKQGDYRAQIYVGAKTAPGDQVFVQVVGDDGIYVVDARLLNFIPKKADDWRATQLLYLNDLAFDRIAITNSGKGFELHREGTNRWRIFTSDFSPRAEASKVDQLLTNIQALRAEQFVPETPGTDLDLFGLQNPEFQFSLAQGTNLLRTVQFGKSPTNDSTTVFARNPALNTVLIVSRTNLTPWPAMPGFRDPHLLGDLGQLENIGVRGTDRFSLVRETNDIWKVMPQNFVADAASVKDLLRLLADMQIVEFVKDVVPTQMLADHGLDHPALQYTLQSQGTNPPLQGAAIQLQFSADRGDKVMVRRIDEPSVYAVRSYDVKFLPRASWQLHDRHIWKFSIDDLARVTIEQHGASFDILRNGDHQWSVAPGSKGEIQPLAVEETMLDLVDLQAATWLARGTNALAQFDFTNDVQRITLEFKNAEKRTIQLSKNSPLNFGVAAVTLEGEDCVFAIPPSLRRDMISYLSIPAAAL